MNRKFAAALAAVISMSYSIQSFADDHEHDEGHQHSEQGDYGDGHGHGAEVSASVGPEKGILEASEAKGFKLSPEALKNFAIKTMPASTGSMKLARSSVFFGLEERNLYRVRDGFFKRIDFKTLSSTKTELTVSSSDLKEGDQIAVEGLGLLRICELAAFGGVSEGHSH